MNVKLVNNHFNLHIIDEIISFLRYTQFVVLKKNVYLCDVFKVVRTHIIRLIDPNMLNIPDISSTS